MLSLPTMGILFRLISVKMAFICACLRACTYLYGLERACACVLTRACVSVDAVYMISALRVRCTRSPDAYVSRRVHKHPGIFVRVRMLTYLPIHIVLAGSIFVLFY